MNNSEIELADNVSHRLEASISKLPFYTRSGPILGEAFKKFPRFILIAVANRKDWEIEPVGASQPLTFSAVGVHA